jgi:hypothetical protein
MRTSQRAELGILQQHMNPSEYFALDDYQSVNAPFDEKFNNSFTSWQQPEHHQQQERENRSSRRGLAFPWSMQARRREEEGRMTANNRNDDSGRVCTSFSTEDPRRTTPLHEAARLGHSELIRLMLKHPGADLTLRNGEHQTPLHCVAVGVTTDDHQYPEQAKEDGDFATAPLGIRRPENVLRPKTQNPDEENEGLKSSTTRKNHASRLGRFLLSSSRSSQPTADSLLPMQLAMKPENAGSLDTDSSKDIEKERHETATQILNWSHPDDGSPLSGLGVSVNAVDLHHGRTALHYAAELGRAEICLSISSAYGANLTIVDDQGKTPCELAADGAKRRRTFSSSDAHLNDDQSNLAAQLEARALLHVDYESMMNDDELMTSIMLRESETIDGTSNRRRLVAPFGWFETRSVAFVQSMRESRLSVAEDKLKELVRKEMEELLSRRAMFESDSTFDVDDGPQTSTQAKSALRGKQERMATSSIQHQRAGDHQAYGVERRHEYVESLVGNGTTCVRDPEWRQRSHDADCEQTPCENLDEDFSYPDAQKCRQRDRDEQKQHAKGILSDCELAIGDVVNDDSCTAEVKRSDTAKTSCSNDTTCLLQSPDSMDASSASPPLVLVQGGDKLAVTEEEGNLNSPFIHLHKAHVELLLDAQGWDVHKAVSAFVADPQCAFRDAKIALPVSKQGASRESECLICCERFESCQGMTLLESCSHSFCRDCLGEYIANCAKAKSGFVIQCPHHECQAPLTAYEIASLSPTMDVYEDLLNTANENFVVKATDFRFCPHPSCSGIVQFQAPPYIKSAAMDQTLLHIVGAVCTASHPSGSINPGRLTYEGVHDPNYIIAKSMVPIRKAHRFCFACGEPRCHWPVDCDRLSKWESVVKHQVNKVIHAETDGSRSEKHDYNDVAQKLWLKTNTRPCPKVCITRAQGPKPLDPITLQSDLLHTSVQSIYREE